MASLVLHRLCTLEGKISGETFRFHKDSGNHIQSQFISLSLQVQ